MFDNNRVYALKRKLIAFFLGPLFLLSIIMTPCPDFLTINAWNFIGVIGFMLIWWLFEPVNSAVTSFLPVFLFPLLGILDSYTTFKSFGSPYVFMFLGGFFIAIAIEKHKLHYTIASQIIKFTGTSSDRVLFAILLTTYLLSMWISNTAVTIIMLPIVSSIINNIDIQISENIKKNFIISALIATAFASTIGGMSTLVGSPPNLILKSFFQETFEVDLHFSGWLMFGLPISLLLLISTWMILVRSYPSLHKINISEDILRNNIDGAIITKNQRLVLLIFILTVIMWVFRPIYEGFLSFEISDEIISIFFGLLLFMIPTSLKDNKFLLEWRDTERLPWGIIFLFGSGIAISSAINELNIFEFIAKNMSMPSAVSQLFALIFIAIFVTIATETINNTSLSIVMIPIASAVCIATGLNPLVTCLFMLMLISTAFILPVATPSNSLIFINHNLTVYDMMKIGIKLKIISVIVISAAYYFGLFDVYKIDFELTIPGSEV